MSASIALVFPGQGAQHPGMVGDLFEASPMARHVLDISRSIAGFDVESLCRDGNEDRLRDTGVAQPALLTIELALLAALSEALGGAYGEIAIPFAVATAGHSLGEYAACVAAGALTVPVAIALATERGRCMAAAPSGTMVAILGMDIEMIREACIEIGGVVVANDNAPGQAVVSGNGESVARVSAVLRERGARRVVPLNVSGAFHSPLMVEAEACFQSALARVDVRDPRVPIVANTSATFVTHRHEVAAELNRQITGEVRWRETLLRLEEAEVTTLVEVGPGEVIANLARRTIPSVAIVNVRSAAEARQCAHALR